MLKSSTLYGLYALRNEYLSTGTAERQLQVHGRDDVIKQTNRCRQVIVEAGVDLYGGPRRGNAGHAVCSLHIRMITPIDRALFAEQRRIDEPTNFKALISVSDDGYVRCSECQTIFCYRLQ